MHKMSSLLPNLLLNMHMLLQNLMLSMNMLILYSYVIWIDWFKITCWKWLICFQISC
jgi:hypothetical protein